MYPTLLLAGVVTAILLWLTVIKFLAKQKVQNLHTKYVFITGCDSGFGRETAIRMDKMGVCVLAACLTKQGEQDLKSMTSDKLKTFLMDVTDSQQIKDVFERVKNLLPTGQEWTPLDHMKRTADVNLWGMIDVTKTFLPLVKKSQGRVVNMSSIAGRMSFPNVSGYCISKYGVEAFSDALRREMSPWGVLVSMITPGMFKTGIGHTLVETIKKFWNQLSAEMKEEYGEKSLDRFVKGLSKAMDIASPDTYKVVDAIVDALTSQQPQSRYVVGWEAKRIVFISYLPTFIADRLMRVKISASS
ncbi:hypothetical protein OS493_009211 [Desmophyllum pertusum]|uniref:Uncharacterized protein n=1 Tax=Desmophyllum pertusum TaxID=174260 RepID=A0A9X0CS04_9CNID|nr:hypothetical protein OS493_009211 [Desmophyllum pertusum]